MTLTSGNFRLIIVVAGTEVPAHLGNISRDSARRMQKVYRAGRPETVTRIRKAV